MLAETRSVRSSTRLARLVPAAVPALCAAGAARHPLRWSIGDRTIEARLGWHGGAVDGVVQLAFGADPPLASLALERLEPWLDHASDLLAEADPLARGLVTQQLADLTAFALGATGLPVRAVDTQAAPTDSVAIDLTFAAVGVSGSLARATLRCAPALASQLTDWWRQRTGAPALRADLPIDMRAHIGSATLPLPELRLLASGDLLLPDRLPLEGGRWQVRLLAGADRRLLARGYIEGELVVITHNDEAMTAGSSTPILQQLAVEVGFELGAHRLPLGELARIGPGYVFDLGAQADGEVVDLVVNGRRIGRGHLVLLGEALGVRVSQVELHAPSPGAGPVVTSEPTQASAATPQSG